MINLRYILRLVIAFVSRFKVLILLSIVFGVFLFFAIRLIAPYLFGNKVERIGIAGRFTPNSLPDSILAKVGNGLTKLEEDGSVSPDLASSWETPDKGKTWIFYLNEGLTWQDGKKVTAQNVNYQFSDVEIKKPDAKTIIFKLQNPYSAFPSVVSHPVFKTGLLGTGSWQVKKLSLAGTFVNQLILENAEGNKEIYKFYPSEDRAILAFELGEVDRLTDILNPGTLTAWKKLKIDKTVNKSEYTVVFFNNADKLLTDKNIRQALSYAINKDAFGEERALGPIPISSWAYNPQVKPYNYDFEKAKGAIDEYKKSAKTDTVTINLTTSALLLDKAELIAEDWEKIGLTVDIQVMSNVPGDFQALLAIFDAPTDPDQYSLWHSTQTATNLTHYNNPRIDKLLEDGRSELDLGARKKIYLDFQRFLVEDSPAVFLYYPTSYTINR